MEVEDRQSNFGLFSGQLRTRRQKRQQPRALQSLQEGFPAARRFRVHADVTGKKMVVRGAYTISSFMEGTGTNLRLPLNPPFNWRSSRPSTRALSRHLPGTTLDQGLSGLNPKDPYIGANIRLWDPNVRPAEVQQWNLTLEYQLPGNNVLTVGYVGQHGTHLMVAMPYFQKQLVNGQSLAQPVPGRQPGPGVARSRQISGTQSGANQKYNALQTTLHKRFSMGIEYQVAYTWSKGMSDSIGYYGEGGQSGSNRHTCRICTTGARSGAPTYFDVKHNFVVSFFYETPVRPRARNLAANWNRGFDYGARRLADGR